MKTSTNPHSPVSDGGRDSSEKFKDFNNDWVQNNKNLIPESTLRFYEDPAIVNPGELATFPKAVQEHHSHHHHESHLVNKRTPVRDGRNITRTDNHPDKEGFM